MLYLATITNYYLVCCDGRIRSSASDSLASCLDFFNNRGIIIITVVFSRPY